ncbi:hypothetical protein Sm713_79290 [Streptomyces sp. TS71-3]|nr:hypothetical protein Sm713_79290 [Streptomyces sp. TS71-3]
MSDGRGTLPPVRPRPDGPAGRLGRVHPVVGDRRGEDSGATERPRCHGAEPVVRGLGKSLT